MTYNYKALQELCWFVLVAVSTTVMQVFLTFEPSQIDDWRLWAVSLGAGAVRAMAGAVLSWLGKNAIGGRDNL